MIVEVIENAVSVPFMMAPETMKMKVNYEGVILTNIDVIDAPEEGRPNKVTFSDTSKGRNDEGNAVFLHNIREVARTCKEWKTQVYYEADKLTVENAKALLTGNTSKEALFVIHGFNTLVSFHLLDCKFANEKAKKVYIVPICWSSEENKSPFEYFKDKGHNRAPDFALKKAVAGPMKELLHGDDDPSILCHSSEYICISYLPMSYDMCLTQ